MSYVIEPYICCSSQRRHVNIHMQARPLLSRERVLHPGREGDDAQEQAEFVLFALSPFHVAPAQTSRLHSFPAPKTTPSLLVWGSPTRDVAPLSKTSPTKAPYRVQSVGMDGSHEEIPHESCLVLLSTRRDGRYEESWPLATPLGRRMLTS